MIQPPSRYYHANLVAFALSIANDVEGTKPKHFIEAVKSIESSKWQLTMKEEIESLENNKTWELVKVPLVQKIVRCKWIFKNNEGTLGVEATKFKA